MSAFSRKLRKNTAVQSWRVPGTFLFNASAFRAGVLDVCMSNSNNSSFDMISNVNRISALHCSE